MRTLTSSALTELAKQYGTEPLIILEVEWSEGSVTYYADKDIFGYKAKILDVSPIDMVLTAENLQSQQVSVTLDDTDGEIKSVLDVTDIHKKFARIYIYYGGLTASDKFEIFTGQISSPFSWSEKERQITFTVLSEVETYEIGFSPEEGQLDFVSPSQVGKPWPLAFGNVVHVPAQKVQQVEEAHLLDMFGIVDPTLDYKLRRAKFLFNQEAFMLQFWQLVQEGADNLARPVENILADLVANIILRNKLEIDFFLIQARLDENKRKVQKNAWNVAARANIFVGNIDLQVFAPIINAAQLQFEQLKEEVKLARYEYELKKRAGQEQVKAYNRMREIMGDILEIEKELCQQRRFVKDIVRVQDSKDIFEESIETEVVIKGLQFTVSFTRDPETMEIVSTPRAQYSDLDVEPWTADDEPCSDILALDGQDMFRLDMAVPPNLQGMYLLVEKNIGPDEPTKQHIIHVKQQIGNKVYFDLVPWSVTGSGGPRGISLDRVIKTLTDVPWIPGPWGAPIPANLGGIDPNIWLRPEFAILQKIVAGIGGPVTKEELTLLVELVYLMPSDKLKGPVAFENPTPRSTFTITGPDVLHVIEAAGNPLEHWFTDDVPFEEVPENAAWFAEPGTAIRAADDTCEIYIANLVPSTIKAVYAYRTNRDGERFLAPVPSKYYIKNESADLGTYQVTALTFKRPLKWIPGEGWEDDVYITMNSSIGRKVVDVLQWLIETYIPGKSVNATNFAEIDALLDDKYPVDFALFDRVDALEEIRQIAWESRLAVIVRGDEFFLKYLSAEPDSDIEIDIDSIVKQSVSVEYTETEDLMTEVIATYNEHYLPLEGRDRLPRVIYRHNVSKYGLHRQNIHFHTFAFKELVEKSATFWLIRRANTWKKIRLRTKHTQLPLEVFDTVTLQYFDDVASDAIKTIVMAATYDTNENLIELILHTGVRSGEMSQYIHFWPALNPEGTEFPTPEDYPGNVGPGAGVIGTIEDC